jgi:glycine/D-amino acid oxidase-like deaminating enzyme/nitrite reductase/ring-hydroxylating ferredoxin subunit
VSRASLWVATTSDAKPLPPLQATVRVDVAVVGAGIFGTTAAYLLKREGLRVALVELHRVGGGTSGYTTAKLTVGHSLIYTDLLASYGVDAAILYAQSNQEAIERMEELVRAESISCDWERCANYVYTGDPTRVGDVNREAQSARRAGIEATITTETDLPYSVGAAIRVEGQAQFHPRRYLLALAKKVEGEGSHVFEQSRVTGVRGGGRRVVEVEGGGRIDCGHVVIATQLAFLDRGLLFAKVHPAKSYAVAGRMAEGDAPRGMYISVDQPTRSIRSTPAGEGKRWLIVGGEGHKPGEDPQNERRYQALRNFARDRFEVAVEYEWSAHDYTPAGRLPYIGRLRRGDHRILTATGFAKWGLTKGTIAAQIVTDTILGRENPYARLYDTKRLHIRQSAPTFLKENGHVARHFFGDRLKRRDGTGAVEQLQPGDGTIVRLGTAQVAISRGDDGVLTSVSARCTHLGCLVGWNPADRNWECPCHGSCFSADGSLLAGPATRDLPARPLPPSYPEPD